MIIKLKIMYENQFPSFIPLDLYYRKLFEGNFISFFGLEGKNTY